MDKHVDGMMERDIQWECSEISVKVSRYYTAG